MLLKAPLIVIALLCSDLIFSNGNGRGIGDGAVAVTVVVALGKTLLFVAAMA